MSSSTAKRLIVYRFDRQPSAALVHNDAYLKEQGVELMSPDGTLQAIDYKDIKALCFAADGAPADLFSAPATFERRPKTTGLWTSFRLRDGDILEGILSHNLLDWPAQGYLLTPPRASALRQRVFLPRQAVVETGVLGIIGKATPMAGKAAKKSPADTAGQLSMFD